MPSPSSASGDSASRRAALEADARFLPAAAGEGVAAGLEAVGEGGIEGGGRTGLCGWVIALR